MSSDLPVGQQSKGSSKRPPLVGPLDVEEDVPSLPSMGRVTGKVKIFTEDGWAAEVARVRAQVAEEIARDHELSERGQQEAAAAMRAEGLTEQARLHDHLAHAYGLAADRARDYAGKAFPSSPAALPDVVGTPDHPEAQEDTDA